MPKQSILVIFFAIISTFILSLAGCGNNNPTSNTTTTSSDAITYLKSASGNRWDWNITQSTGLTASRTVVYGSTTASGTYVYGAVVAAPGTLTIKHYLDIDQVGNIIFNTAFSPYLSCVYMPANLPVGKTWTAPLWWGGYIVSSGTVRYTVAGVNISQPVPGFVAPFNDVLQLDVSSDNFYLLMSTFGGMTTLVPASISGSYFLSKQVGNLIYASTTITPSGSSPISETVTLRPGYIAN